MLRPAEQRDLDAIREWRNQEANRAVSITTHEITPSEHAAWWQRVQDDPTRRCLVFEYSDRPLGVVNVFDIDDEAGTASWGFFLDHDTLTAEGTVMLAWMKLMREATRFAFTPEPDGLGLTELRGEVRPENEAVRSMNRRFGFVEGEPYDDPTGDDPLDGDVVTLIPITLHRPADQKGPR